PVARSQADVRHADQRDPIPSPGAAAAHAVATDAWRGFATGQVADELPRRNDRHVLGRHALVIPAEAAEPAGRGRVRVDVDQLAAVPEVVKLVERQEGGSGERRLHAQHAVELDGMSARLVDLLRELAGFDDHRHLTRWT